MIKERISYVIPIAMDDSKSGTPVLIYEMTEGSHEVDLSFGVFFIGLRAAKKYSVGIEVFNDHETPIPIDTKQYSNHKFFTVAEANDGETIVSTSMRINFPRVKIIKPGIFEVRASLVNPEEGEVIDVKSSFFDVKRIGLVRDEFR
ncbi:hypothetical protein GKU49_14570 [Salmonella enterica]|nr:hypothetical protein [Salmonella enterica]EDS5481436.1 hypothetical protein [Salmonella enterica subsp. enterica serovar Panama]EDT9925507.1 hypothetical protein [Salmonella enterica subsp. enterica serovar Saintpaul]EEF5927437.1 hypothetical protein [Salmonella enterica]EIZ6792127.1 hypothetical protein [Salmonella enterica]